MSGQTPRSVKTDRSGATRADEPPELSSRRSPDEDHGEAPTNSGKRAPTTDGRNPSDRDLEWAKTLEEALLQDLSLAPQAWPARSLLVGSQGPVISPNTALCSARP
jgi:hypothetical protein